jgi:GntR family transcriptional regulator
VNSVAETPAYQLLADTLRTRIEDGVFPPGSLVPSRAELQRDYGATEFAARKALDALFDEGLIIKRDRNKHVVADRGEAPQLLRRTSGPDRAAPFKAVTSSALASAAVADRLGLQSGAPVLCTTYTYLSERKPVRLTTAWEPATLSGPTAYAFPEAGPHAGIGVVARMTALGITVASIREVVGGRRAGTEEARALAVPRGAMVRTVRQDYVDTTGRTVATADSVMPMERWQLEYDVPVKP